MMGGQTAYLSKEQFYKECHISKRLALWLIQSGLVSAIDTERKTDRYIIARSAVEQYLHDRELDPARYRYMKPGKDVPGGHRKMSAACLRELRCRMEILWCDVPDLVSLKEASELIGYNNKRLNEWRQNAGLETIILSRHIYFQKRELIRFILSPTLLNLSPKSAKHIEIMREIHYEGM